MGIFLMNNNNGNFTPEAKKITYGETPDSINHSHSLFTEYVNKSNTPNPTQNVAEYLTENANANENKVNKIIYNENNFNEKIFTDDMDEKYSPKLAQNVPEFLSNNENG